MSFKCDCGSTAFKVEDRGSKYTYPISSLPESYKLKWGSIWATPGTSTYFALCVECGKYWGPAYSMKHLRDKMRDAGVL